MKISSASKKVLASALSAAMVVAFAPTVAFAAKGEAANLTFDLQGGSATTSVDYPYAKQGDTITLPTVVKAGYTASWTVDNDGDGQYDDDTVESAGEYTIGDNEAKTAFKAVYAAPKISNVEFTAASGKDPAKFTISAGDTDKTATGVEYKMKFVNPDGVTLWSNTGLKDSQEVTVDADFLSAGAYTATITADGVELSKKVVNIVEVTTNDAKGNKTGTVVYDAAADLATIAEGLGYNSAKPEESTAWLKGGFSFVASPAALKDLRGEVKLTATGSSDIAVTAGGYDNTDKDLWFNNEYKSADNTISYELKDPSGAVIYTASMKGGSFVDVSFDQKSTYAHVKDGTSIMAGDYVLTVTETDADGDKVASGKAKITITEFKYDAGDGYFKYDNNFKKDTVDFFTDDVSEDAINAAKNAVQKPGDGYENAVWTLNGKAFDAVSNPVKAGQVNTWAASFKAIDKTTWVKNPTIASATYDTTVKAWYLTFASETANVSFSVTNATYDGTKKAYKATAATVTAQAKINKGQTDPSLTRDSEVVTFTRDVDAWSGIASGTAAVNKKVGKSTGKWADIASVKAALEAGQKAVDGAGWKSEDDMDALLNENAKAVYDAVAAAAAAELSAYEGGALVVVGDKAYSMDATKLSAAQKKVAKVGTELAKIKKPVLTDYQGAVVDVIKAANDALNNDAAEDKTVTVADVTAAKAVTAAIAALPAVTADNAKDVKAAAEKAIADYAALTDGAKKLVSSADYAKATAAVAAADKAIAEAAATAAAQDKAAVAKVKGKTVKAKAKKKTTAKLTVVTSKSGAKSTFKKTSGNAKITVAKGGKITVKKGLKAGKTYKAKVKATVGAATKTVTVTVTVK